MWPTIFQASRQEPLSGNRTLIWGIGLGVLLAFPLPLYVLPLVLISRFFSKYALQMVWILVWGHVSLPNWGWGCLFLLWILVFRQKRTWYLLCLCPLLYKGAMSEHIGLCACLVCVISICWVRTAEDDGFKVQYGVSLAVLLSTLYVWRAGAIEQVHRIGLLGLWKHSQELTVAEQKKAISLEPTDHAWISRQNLLIEEKIRAGWMPETADLEDGPRIKIARALDEDSRRGEAYRLLWKARQRPKVAWEYMRLLRYDAHSIPSGLKIEPPFDVISEGTLELEDWWTHNQCQSWMIHSRHEILSVELALEVEATPGYFAVLKSSMDGQETSQQYNSGQHILSSEGRGVGPHTFQVCFTNDTYNLEHDINVHLQVMDIDSFNLNSETTVDQ